MVNLSPSDMAVTPEKRQRVSEYQRAQKKQKIQHETSSAITVSTTKIVSIEQLPWKEVPLPDILDDAEGFFGLEEIEGVEVIRDASGIVQYRVANQPSQAISASNTKQEKADAKAVESVSNDGSEWEGFEEESISRSEDKTSQKKVLSMARPHLDQSKPKKEESKNRPEIQKKRRKSTDDVSPPKNEFLALEDLQNEDSSVDVSEWASLGLSPEILSSLAKMGFSHPTPIQQFAIPEIKKGHDVIGKASTGSGKTLAFGIPIMEHYLSASFTTNVSTENLGQHRLPPLALVLSPTRELAHQLAAHFSDLASGINSNTPRIATLTGGLSLLKQQRLLERADIIIGTPGRLWEVISASTGLLKWLKQVKYLVVDEADRLLSEGQFKEVEEILNSLDREEPVDDDAEVIKTSASTIQRQTLVFSATLQKDLHRKLAGKGKPGSDNVMGKQESMEYLLKKINFREDRPKFVDVNPISQMASKLKEGIVECAGLEKDLYLYALLMQHPNIKTLVFANSIAAVRRLTPFLQNLDLPAYALHSQMPQKARLRAIERLSALKSSTILVATDVAARGLDIPAVQLVIHYHVPRAADMYIHRSGRTARADNSGWSVLICAPEEVQGVRRLVAKVHARHTDATAEPNNKFFMRSLDLNRHILTRLKPRVGLSKKIADAILAKEKLGSEDNWLKAAAEDLGVDYDSEEFAVQDRNSKGRGQGRRKLLQESKNMSKSELASLKAELRALLSQRVNTGVSERYLSAGGIDIDELLENGVDGRFLGNVDGWLSD